MAIESYIELRNLQKLLADKRLAPTMPVKIKHGALQIGDNFEVDFGSEEIRGLQCGEAQLTSDVTPKNGKYVVEVKGNRVGSGSLKECLKQTLLLIEELHPGMLDGLTQIKPRTKRIVARQRHDLFDLPKQSETFSEALKEGWFFGTNNSAEETRTWIKRAAECAGIRWGKDVVVEF